MPNIFSLQSISISGLESNIKSLTVAVVTSTVKKYEPFCWKKVCQGLGPYQRILYINIMVNIDHFYAHFFAEEMCTETEGLCRFLQKSTLPSVFDWLLDKSALLLRTILIFGKTLILLMAVCLISFCLRLFTKCQILFPLPNLQVLGRGNMLGGGVDWVRLG